MKTVLTHTLTSESKSFSESLEPKILHLIGCALQEQESGNYEFLAFTEKAVKWEIYNLLENLLSSQRIVVNKDLLTWILEKYRLVSGYPLAAVGSAPLQTTKSKVGDKGKLFIFYSFYFFFSYCYNLLFIVKI